jgi:hypothetical protein
MSGDLNFWDILTTDEAEFSQAIMRDLGEVAWAQPLLADIAATGGLTRANKAKLFELRFGYALHQAGITPAYEIAGEGDSTLDFGFTASDQTWRTELMRLEETEAVRGATRTSPDESGTIWSSQILNSNAQDRRQSEEGETLKAVQRICQKLERDGRPHKFQPPDGTYHAILIDTRNFLHGGDEHDCVHVALGGEFVAHPMCRRYWEGNLISGVFSPQTQVRGAALARERVHFLGFINEGTYAPGALASATRFVANPNLFATAEEARRALLTWPLEPRRHLVPRRT